MTSRKIEIASLPEIFAGVKKDFTERQSTPKLPTGLRALDRIIWGLHRKELLTIGARPSEGKSSFAVQLALNLNNTLKNVLFISLEMSKEQIVERMFCNLTGTDNLKLREGRAKYEPHLPIFERMVSEMPLLVVDNCGYHFKDVEKLIVEMDPRPDIVFLDYIQLVSQGNHTSKSMAVEEYFRKMKELSITYNFSMVVLSQIRRMAEKRQNKRPTMDELKWSGALEEHCLDGDTLIYNVEEKRNYKIKDIYKKQFFFPIKTSNMKTNEVIYAKPNKILDKGELECYRIRTKSGKEIIVSKGTQFYNNKWRKIEDLQIGDKIYVQKGKSS